YKSAAEIFMRKGPSKEAEEMQNWLFDSLYDTSVKLIAKGRGVKPDRVKHWIDEGPYTAESAKKAGLIDAVEHRQDLTAHLRGKFGKDLVFNHKYGEKKGPRLDFSSPFAAFKLINELLGEAKKKKSGKTAVGIVYVEGPILTGSGQPSPFTGLVARSS